MESIMLGINELYFAKLKESAKIPTKDIENAGYDIYACFDDDCIEIAPHTTKMIPTGICSAFLEDYVMILKERGSTGTKGIAQRCGVIDSGFRGEWKVPVTNTTNKRLYISKSIKEFEEYSGAIYYPYSKAISQAILLPVPRMEVIEISPEELKMIYSRRGNGMLGSSGK